MTAEPIDRVIVNALLEGKIVIVPDFGYLELKTFPDCRRTVLFKALNPNSLPQRVYLDGQESGSHFSALWDSITKPLKEGKPVLMPNLGIFRPLRRSDGNFHLSFTPSSILKKRLSEEWTANDEPATVYATEKKVAEPVKREISLAKSDTDVKEKAKEIPQAPREMYQEAPLVKLENRNLSNEMEIAKTELFSKITTKKPDAYTYNTEKAGAENENIQEDEFFLPDDIFDTKKKNILPYCLIAAAVILLVVIILTVFFRKKETAPLSELQTHPRNLVDVARKNYGNPAFWVYIYDSNQDKLTSPVNVPENVTLTIPDLSEYNIDITDSLEIIRARIRSESIIQKYIEKINN
jgi:nucleoid DNA-binding protein